jgi:hypothetical protein
MKNEKNLEENTVGTCSNVLKQKAILFGSEYMNEEIITATKCFFKKKCNTERIGGLRHF